MKLLPHSVQQLDTSALANLCLYLAWTVALLSSLGSLYFSEVSGFAPCMLCWYQRIAMYPLVSVLLVGILTKDCRVTMYSLPLAVAGWAIALWHNLLYYGLVTETDAACRAGVSCTTEYISWLGFLTIPLLSLIAFSIIIAALLIHRRILKNV